MKKKKIRNKQAQTKIAAAPAVSRNLKPPLGIMIAVLAFILYAQSIQHNYTLDDHPVIDENNITKMGLSGIPTILKTDYWYGAGRDQLRGPIYRPTSLIVFAAAWELSPDDPHVYHFINVFFYAISCLLLFLVLCKLFKTQNLLFPFVCALLYTAHPIHTEVVNNIKSLDEILCFLFGLIAIWFQLKYLSSKSIWSLVFMGISFFLALISKETGITFLLVIPLAVFFFTDIPLKKIGASFLLLVAITGIWLLIRSVVFKDLPEHAGIATSILNNTMNAAPDSASKYATIFYILLRYIVLLIFPHPLSCDYNFAQIKIQTFSDPGALIGIILYFGLGIYALLKFRKKGILAFGILFYLITLAPVSNLFFLGGSTMAERFMYIPSLGFCIVLAHFLIRLTKTERIKIGFKNLYQFFALNKRLFFIVLVIGILYSFKTISRNKDWKDDITIFSHDVKISPNSATAHFILGSTLAKSVLSSPDKKSQADTFAIAKSHLKRAIGISPDYRTASSYLGFLYLTENNNDSAYFYLKGGIEKAPDDPDLNYYLGVALFNLQRHDEALKVLLRAVALNTKNEDAYFKLAAIYLMKGDPDNGLLCYSKIIEVNPNNAYAYFYAGQILRSKGDTVKANAYINKAASLGYSPK